MKQSARSLADVLTTRAYAFGRRSSLARAIVARLRRLRSAALGQRADFVAGELGALFSFLRHCGCTFHSCTVLGANPEPLDVAFRYDVHVRDIAACHAFVEAHRAERVPATFFLFWDYSALERSYSGAFQELAEKIAAPLEIGLHDSPVDAWLIQSQFRFDRGAYWGWLKSPAAVAWIAAMAADKNALEELHAAVLRGFISRVHRMQERFGPIASVAAHGGDLRQALHPKLDALGPGVAQVGRNLFASAWLTPERVAAAGLEACVDRQNRSRGRWCQVSDGGGAIGKMVQRMQVSLERKAAMQILLHPFTWDGARRDGELSHLLAGGGRTLRG